MVSRSQNGGLVRFGSMRWPAQTCPPRGAARSDVQWLAAEHSLPSA